MPSDFGISDLGFSKGMAVGDGQLATGDDLTASLLASAFAIGFGGQVALPTSQDRPRHVKAALPMYIGTLQITSLFSRSSLMTDY